MSDKLVFEYEMKIEQFEQIDNSNLISIVKLFLLHLGTNLNKTNISKEAVLASQDSFKNVPIIYRLNTPMIPSLATDVTAHASTDEEEQNTYICGIVPSEATFDFEENDGLTQLVTTGIIYKMYQPVIIDILKNRGGNVKVSIEIFPLEATQGEDGVLYIQKFQLCAIALLGEGIQEGIKNSHLEVIKFSADDLNKEYSKTMSHYEIPDNVKENSKHAIELKNSNGGGTQIGVSIANYIIQNNYISSEKANDLLNYFKRHQHNSNDDNISWLLRGGTACFSWLKEVNQKVNKVVNVSKDEIGTKPALKIDKSKESMSDGAWSDKGLAQKCLEAKNWEASCKAAFRKLEDGWKDGKEGALGYPVMEIKSDTLVYNRKGLASAKAYAEKNNESGVLSALRADYKHLGLPWDGQDDNSDKKDGEKVEEEKKTNAEATKNTKVENAVEEKPVEKNADEVDYAAKFADMEKECDALKNKLAAYEAKEAKEKMSADAKTYMEQFAHCFSEDDVKELNSAIDECDTIEQFTAKVDDKVKAFAIALKDKLKTNAEDDSDEDSKDSSDDEDSEAAVKNEKLKNAVSSPFIFDTYDFGKKDDGEDALDSIIKKSNVKL